MEKRFTMDRRLALGIGLSALLPASPAMAGEGIASPWTDFREARIRLIALRPKTGASRMEAGLEIRLAPEYKTYWRNAGDSGVPPVFDFSASTGIGKPEVAFPFPTMFDDGAGGKAWGYKQAVILPISVPVEKPDFTLVLKLDFAVCGTVCIPLHAELRLDPQRAQPFAETKALMQARALVPRPVAADAPPLLIARLAPAEPPHWRIRVPFEGDPSTFRAFPETGGFLEMKSVSADGPGFISLVITGQAAPGSGGKFGPVRVTYGEAGKSFERVIDLDGAPVAP